MLRVRVSILSFFSPDPVLDFIHRIRIRNIFMFESGSGFYQTSPSPDPDFTSAIVNGPKLSSVIRLRSCIKTGRYLSQKSFVCKRKYFNWSAVSWLFSKISFIDAKLDLVIAVCLHNLWSVTRIEVYEHCSDNTEQDTHMIRATIASLPLRSNKHLCAI